MVKAYAVGVLLLAASAAFGIGYQVGLSDQPVPPRARRDVQPALDGVAARLRDALLEEDSLLRAREVAATLAALEADALDQVREAYDAVFLDIGDLELVLLAEWWAGFDPAAAYAWARDDWRAGHALVAQAALRAWARSEPRDALAQAEAERNALSRRPLVHAVLQGWDESGEPGLLDYVRSLEEAHDRQRAIAVVVRRRVLRDGVEASIDWAERIPEKDGLFRLNVFQRVASAAAEVDTAKAAAFAEEHLDEGRGYDLPQRVGTRWAKRDPEAAMEWLASLPPTRTQQKACEATYRLWVNQGDREAAFQWLTGRDLEPSLDGAVAVYAKRLATEDPSTGLAWAERIHDETLRNPTIGRIVRVWVLSDEPAAMAWLASSSLPESYKERILEIPASMRQFGARGARAAESSAGEEEAASAAIGEVPPGSDLVELPGS